MIQDHDYDVYDVPDSPAKRLKKNNGSWRPWVVSQRISDPGNIIHVSTPVKRSETNDQPESHLHGKQQATPRRKSNLKLVQEALRTEPENGLSLDDIIDWLRTNRSAVYQECGEEKLRRAINATLKQQAQKTNPTIWQWENKNWQLDETLLAGASTKKDTNTSRQAHTPSAMVTSSTGKRTSDGASESCEDTSGSDLQQTQERHYLGSQNTSPAAMSRVRAEYRLASIESQPSQSSPKIDAPTEEENLASNKATPSATSAVSHPVNQNETLVQSEPAAGSISVAPNNEPTTTVESQAPADPCDDSGRDGKDEPDYGQIVRELHRLKQERKLQTQKVEAGHNSLPDVNTLTQSASDAQRAADEAQRAADEAQRIADEKQRDAETANQAVEDAQAKQSELAADKLYLEKLIRASTSLRAQLDID
jgi:hypothetical protein